jgi:ABC-type multidrug transport system ATPase subunit
MQQEVWTWRCCHTHSPLRSSTLANAPSCSPRCRYLVEREGGWAACKEWGEVLSLGEQQRLGMARLFFHRPLYGVLDECTNATSLDIEEALYRHAASLGITLVTITQVCGCVGDGPHAQA